MRYYVIKVGDFSYTAFSPSTCEAVAEALNRFPHAKSISVRSRMHVAVPGAVQSSGDAPCLARRHALGAKNGHARLPVASDAAGQAGWGKGLAH